MQRNVTVFDIVNVEDAVHPLSNPIVKKINDIKKPQLNGSLVKYSLLFLILFRSFSIPWHIKYFGWSHMLTLTRAQVRMTLDRYEYIIYWKKTAISHETAHWVRVIWSNGFCNVNVWYRSKERSFLIKANDIYHTWRYRFLRTPNSVERMKQNEWF